MNDFDDDFDNFDNNEFNDFNDKKSLKDIWAESPMMKIFTIAAGVILVIAAVSIFSTEEEQKSRTGAGLDQNTTLGGEVSQNYSEVIEEVNEQRLDTAVKTGTSTIPMLVNTEEQELISEVEELPPYQEFDPLATFRAAVQETPEEPEIIEPEPTLVAPEQVFQPQPIQQQIPAPAPETVQALAEAMSNAAGDLLNGHKPTAAKIMQVTSNDYLNPVITNESGFNGTYSNADTIIDDINTENVEEIIETILIPAGTINYAQIMIEANSDVPGPVLAQLMSGPLAGSKLIGDFTTAEEVLTLNFNSIIVDGINMKIKAIAIDPNTTLPGVATEVDQRYWQRVLLPAAARFLEGVGSAIAEDTQTTVTVSGDTVIEQQDALDFEQELGRGVEEGFQEISDFMEEESEQVKPLIRVARGTPVGIFFTEPVIEVK